MGCLNKTHIDFSVSGEIGIMKLSSQEYNWNDIEVIWNDIVEVILESCWNHIIKVILIDN